MTLFFRSTMSSIRHTIPLCFYCIWNTIYLQMILHSTRDKKGNFFYWNLETHMALSQIQSNASCFKTLVDLSLSSKEWLFWLKKKQCDVRALQILQDLSSLLVEKVRSSCFKPVEKNSWRASASPVMSVYEFQLNGLMVHGFNFRFTPMCLHVLLIYTRVLWYLVSHLKQR